VTWITDENGNRASIELWGSESAARESLQTLKDCSRCSNCSRCSDLKDSSPEELGKTNPLYYYVPVVDDLHRRIYAAASHPEALAMGAWHTCEKTHCRAGWRLLWQA
jgi:hypothetical protein